MTDAPHWAALVLLKLVLIPGAAKSLKICGKRENERMKDTLAGGGGRQLYTRFAQTIFWLSNA